MKTKIILILVLISLAVSPVTADDGGDINTGYDLYRALETPTDSSIDRTRIYEKFLALGLLSGFIAGQEDAWMLFRIKGSNNRSVMGNDWELTKKMIYILPENIQKGVLIKAFTDWADRNPAKLGQTYGICIYEAMMEAFPVETPTK